MGFFLMEVEGDQAYIWIQNPLSHTLGLIIPRSQYVSGHVSERVFGRSSRIRHRNALTEKAWEDALQGLAKHALPCVWV